MKPRGHRLGWGLGGIALLSLLSCETVVDVPPPPHTPQLVAQGFFTPDSLWIVRVTRTTPFTAATPPAFLQDASVEVWEDGQLLARPALTDSGTYVAAGRGAQPGHTYTLRVSAPDHVSIEGHDRLPAPPEVTAFHEQVIPPLDSTTRRYRTRVEVTLQDPPAEDNYYGLLVVQARWSVDPATGQVLPLLPSLFPFESEDAALEESALDVLNQDAHTYLEAFFSDDPFQGNAHTFAFDLQYDAPIPGAGLEIQRAWAVVLLSVSEDLYRYWKTAGQQALTNENPFAEPLRVHSNMTNGFGVFAGFQYRLYPLTQSSTALLPGIWCAQVGPGLPICGGTR
jgi:hypothetical protein